MGTAYVYVIMFALGIRALFGKHGKRIRFCGLTKEENLQHLQKISRVNTASPPA